MFAAQKDLCTGTQGSNVRTTCNQEFKPAPQGEVSHQMLTFPENSVISHVPKANRIRVALPNCGRNGACAISLEIMTAQVIDPG